MENKVYMELQCTFHGSVLANQGHKAFLYIYMNAGRDWGQEEKGMTEDEMAGWHH